MTPSKPIHVGQLKTLRRPMRDPDCLFLHALLNYHLGPPDDQLPLTGPDAEGFGPRTEAKVKRFQELNNIDRGSNSFMDGVVGPHTWAELNNLKEVRIDLMVIPVLRLTPPTFPGKLPPFPSLPSSPSTPPLIPVPKLHLDNFQLQVGESVTVPFQGKVTAAHTIQLVGVFLSKSDGFHLEGQAGPQLAFNRGPGLDSKTDLSFSAVLNFANLPGSGKVFTWSVQAQAALIESLSKRSTTAQGSVVVGANFSLLKIAGQDVIQATIQGGPYAELDPPSADNGQKWTFKPGVLGFFGFTGTLNF